MTGHNENGDRRSDGEDDNYDVLPDSVRAASDALSVDSDVDDTQGRYSETDPVSFQEARAQARTVLEAATARNDSVTEPPVPSLPGDAESLPATENDTADGNTETDDGTVITQADVVAFLTQDGWRDAVTTVQSGSSRTAEYELVRATVDGQDVFALLKTHAGGVTMQTDLVDWGQSLVYQPLRLDTEALNEALATYRRHVERLHRYQETPVPNQLTDAQQAAIQERFQGWAADFLPHVADLSEKGQQQFNCSVELVDRHVVVSGQRVANHLEAELGSILDEDQLSVVLKSITDPSTETLEIPADADGLSRALWFGSQERQTRSAIAARIELW